MSASKAKAGEAFVEISTRNGLLDKGLAAAQASMRRLAASTNAISATMGRGFMSVGGTLSSLGSSAMSLKGALAGAAAASGVGMMVKGFADAAGNIDDMSKRTGLAAEEIQGLSFAAKMSGTSIEAVEGAVRKMQKEIASGNADAFTGLAADLAAIPNPAQRAAAAAKALGVSIDAVPKTILDPSAGRNIDAVRTALGEMTQAAGKTPMATFRAMADRIAAIADPSQRAAEAMRIFGKSGTALLPMFENGSAGMDELMGEAERLGLVMSGDAVTAGAQLGDTLDKVWLTVGALSNRIGSILAPTLQTLLNAFVPLVAGVSHFIEQNKEWIVYAAYAAAAVAAVTVGVVSLGAVIGGVGAAMTALGAAIGGALTVVTGIIGAILSPIGIAVAAVVGLGAAFLYFSGVGSQVLQFISDKFAALLEYVMPMINGIGTALSSGQWGEAANIAMLGVEQAMRIGMQPLYNIWTDLYTWIVTASVDVVATLANVFAGIPTTIMNAFSTGITFVEGLLDQFAVGFMMAFDTVFTWLVGTWDQTVNGIAKALLYLYSLFDKSIDYEAAAKQMDADAKKRSDQRQTNLDTAITDRRKASDERANQRQKSLDDTVNTRNEDLMRANQSRLEYGEGIKRGVRDQANERKGQFDQRIKELGKEIAESIERVNKNAAAADTETETTDAPDPPDEPKMPDIATIAESTAVKTQGTFSGFGAGILGSGQSALDRLEKETKSQTAILQSIAKNTAEDDSLEMSK
jgi:hypothetical protein